MSAGQDFRVRNVAEMILTLRADLVITPRRDGDEPGYLVEDRVNSKYHRVGLPEYTFMALLDGRTPVKEALSITARVEPQNAITEEQAATICRWLVENQLAHVPRHGSAGTSSSASHKGKATSWNPLFLRIPLLRPERWLNQMLPGLSWLFSGPATVAVLLWAGVAGYHVLMNWNRFAAASRGILSPERWLWTVLAWIAVKILHELAHGLVCKRYGGSVREAGVVLILATPVAYMDVSTSWRFRSKWQRIHTAAAGMYLELLIAATAGFVWTRLDAGVLSDLCFQVMILASATTLLFNANPLMRFDGYYILSDLLEVPNLYGQGQQFLRQLVRNYLLGVQASFPWSWRRMVLLGVYGVASLFWRVLICVGLAVAAGKMFRGAGIVLAVIGITLWTVPPTIAAVKYLLFGTPWEQPRRVRFAISCGLLAALTGMVLVLPWPGTYRAPAIVEYAPQAVVRTTADGFVAKIHVRPGQQVAADAPLIELQNDPLQLEVVELQIKVRQSEARVRALQYDAKTPESQAEREQLESLRQELTERKQLLDGLMLRAPVSGHVVAADLDSLRGTYLERGAAVLVIGSPDRKELRISVAQEDTDIFAARVGGDVAIRLRGSGSLRGKLTEITPRASRSPTNPGFCAPHGGPLPVRALEYVQSEAADQPKYELVAPRFDGTIRLTAEQSRQLLSGQRGVVALRASDRSIADHLRNRLRNWIRSLAAVPTAHSYQVATSSSGLRRKSGTSASAAG